MKSRIPAEWERHEATWLAWPHNAETWHHGSLIKAQQQFVFFINEILKGESVCLLIPKKELKNPLVGGLKEDRGQLYFYEYETNDSWIRDYGPDFLVSNDKLVSLNWEYNSWGGKYPPYSSDNQANILISSIVDVKRIDLPHVLEGGSVEFDGKGNVITTRSCLLNPNRNPELSIYEIEQMLKANYDLRNVIWLDEGIEGDDTDGHIDDFCRFTPSKKILFAEGRKGSADEKVLNLGKASLEQQLKEMALPYQVVNLPMPSESIVFQGEELPASYANYYVCNAGVLVPVFGDKHDDLALRIIQECFKDRSVLAVPAEYLVIGLGGLHCLSKQQPAVDKL